MYLTSYPFINQRYFQYVRFGKVIQSIKMIYPKNISSATKTFVSLIKFTPKDNLLKQNSASILLNQTKLIHNQMFYFTSFKKNTVPPSDSAQNSEELRQIKDKIENMYLKLNEKEQLKELQRIIYPEALLNGQQDISKLSKLYDLLISRFEKQDPDKAGIEQLIKAGDFYMKMNARRLKALKPYQRAKQMIEAQSLQQTPQMENAYKLLCDKIGTLIKQQIVDGQCSGVQQYFKKGLQQQRQGNQLQSIYYFHKGLCISEYQSIPDKLLHFNLQAHYLFLSELMRPACPYLKENQRFDQSIQRYEQLEQLGKKWFKEELKNTQDYSRKKSFQNTLIWVCSNKGDIYYRAHKFQEAAKCYEKVIEFCKTARSADDRIKIVNVIENLQKAYNHLGLDTKAINFLQWAHDFVKAQTSQSPILKSRYLKPIDEMLIAFYEKHKRKEGKVEENFSKKMNRIQKEIRQIVS